MAKSGGYKKLENFKERFGANPEKQDKPPFKNTPAPNRRGRTYDHLNGFEKRFGGGQDTKRPPFQNPRLDALKKRANSKES